jgi:hypothetical protein
MNCPKCRRKQYWWCSNPECVCHKIPAGTLPQVQHDDDSTSCPYCGFRAHMDFWEERSMKELDRMRRAEAGEEK